MEQLFAKLNNSFESKILADLELRKKYKANNFQLIDTQYRKKITVTLDDKFEAVLPDRYTKLIEKSDLKWMNEKLINLIYNGLEDVKNGKKFIKLNSHNFYILFNIIFLNTFICDMRMANTYSFWAYSWDCLFKRLIYILFIKLIFINFTPKGRKAKD